MKKVYIDVLNIMACFAVVVLHCTDKAWDVDGSKSWYFAIMLQGTFIWAVTVFFMLTGAKCLNYRERYGTKIFLKKHVIKIVLVLLLSSIFYLFFFSYTGRVHYESIGDAVRGIVNNEVVTIYWFFSRLIPLYLCIPIVSVLSGNMRIYYLVLTAIVNFVLPYIDKLLNIKLTGYTLHFSNSIIALAILGWLLDTKEIKKGVRICIYLAGIFCLPYSIIRTVQISLPQKEYLKDYLNSTSSITTILVATALWTAVKYFGRYHKVKLSERMVSFIRTVSSCCFGVYIIQMVILEGTNKLNREGIISINKRSPYYSVFGSVIIFVVCLLLVYIGKKLLSIIQRRKA